MKSLLLALCAALFATSCVMPSDLRAIADAQEEYQLNVRDTLDELGRETITAEEADERIADSQTTLLSEVEATLEGAEERTKAMFDAVAVGAPVTGHPLLDLGITGALSALGLNSYRDRRRKKRKEPVAVPDQA